MHPTGCLHPRAQNHPAPQRNRHKSTAIAIVNTEFARTEAVKSTPISTATISPTKTPKPTATPTSLPIVPLDGLRMAYIVDGNLYIQDSGKEPVQLTNSGKDHAPIFSDDGEKIIFSRSDFPSTSPRDIYSINADGTQEQVLITSTQSPDRSKLGI